MTRSTRSKPRKRDTIRIEYVIRGYGNEDEIVWGYKGLKAKTNPRVVRSCIPALEAVLENREPAVNILRSDEPMRFISFRRDGDQIVCTIDHFRQAYTQRQFKALVDELFKLTRTSINDDLIRLVPAG